MIKKLMFCLKKRRLFLEFYFNHISKRVIRSSEGKLIIYKKSSIVIGKGSLLCLNGNFYVGKEAIYDNLGFTRITICGKGKFETDGGIMWSGSMISIIGGTLSTGMFHINYGSIIRCCKHIVIGKEAFFARNVFVSDSDLHFIKGDNSGDIIIGNHVWIATNVTILKNTTIGDNCVIAANTLLASKVITDNKLVFDKRDKNEVNIDGWKA